MTKQELLEELKGAMSQEELADRIGVSQAQVSRVMAGGDAGRRFMQGLVRAFPDSTEKIVAVFLVSDYPDRDVVDAEALVAEKPEAVND